MLQIREITKKSKDFNLVKDLYYSAFPVSEQAPMWLLLKQAKKDFVNFVAYYDKDEFVGFTYTTTHGNLTYLLYIAINADIRSKGYGSQILNCIKDFYPDNRIILNIETEDEKADNNEERKKRKNFYTKNGYSPAGFLVNMNDGIFEMLINNGVCTSDEFLVLFKKYIGFIPSLFYKPKTIEQKGILP